MNRRRICFCGLLALTLSLLLTLPVSANSSWRWISETRPYDLLPFVIAATLAIEFTVVLLALRERKVRKALLVVTLANLLSFAAPYLYLWGLYRLEGVFSFQSYFEEGPSFTVGGVYLFVTLLIELPVVWLALRKDAKDKRQFALLIVAVNVLTTCLTALAERLFCRGHW